MPEVVFYLLPIPDQIDSQTLRFQCEQTARRVLEIDYRLIMCLILLEPPCM